MEGKIHTTNYFNTLIKPAEDCPVKQSEEPPLTDKLSVARQQYEVLISNPYRYTSDEVLFSVFVIRNDIAGSEKVSAKPLFFSKGQACFRASPLTKRYGWAVHFDAEGKMAIMNTTSREFLKICDNNEVKKVTAMRSKR